MSDRDPDDGVADAPPPPQEPDVSSPTAGSTDQDVVTEPAAPVRGRGRRWLRRTLITIGVLGLVLAVAIGGGAWYLTNRYAGNIDRIANVFDGLDEDSRPAASSPTNSAVSEDPITFLLVGSDTRAEVAPGELPDARSDAIMIARFAGDRAHAQVISIPRDSWVEIPGHGKNKINAAYAFGGPTLLIQTVEQLTGIRIDHYAAIDFAGLIQVTDDLGGVDVNVAQTTKNGPYTFAAGLDHLDGAQARWYVGQRHGLAGGDFDRERRQQQYLKAMFGKLFSSDTFTNPARLDSAMRAVTGAVAVDSTLSNSDLLGLAYSLRNVTPANVDYFTAPVLGTGREGAASVVYLDASKDARMWGYLTTDSLSQNSKEFSAQSLPDVPN
jgi:LCP family protein required for cell wall assembly